MRRYPHDINKGLNSRYNKDDLRCRETKIYQRFDTLFEDYLVGIALTSDQSAAIDRKLGETLSLFLNEYNGDVDIYAQGSFAMGTAVRPLTENQAGDGNAGEYDVDIVLERTLWGYAEPTLRAVRSTLSDQYGGRVDSKLRETCERVHHDIDGATGVGFHVDYVPIKYDGSRNAAKRSKNVWFTSDTKRLAEWFADYSSDYTFLPAMILIMKRMRDYAGLTDTLSSICITALVCMYYQEKGSYADDLLGILDGAIARFSVTHEALSIRIEPLPDDLADKISDEQQAVILAHLNKVRETLTNAFESSDLRQAQSVLSTAFPGDIAKYPEMLTALRSREWGIELDGSLSVVDISEDHGRGSYLTRVRRKFFSSGESLIFRANEYDKHKYGIRWQVLNSETSPPGKRRGNLFKARGADGVEGSSSNKFVNHETEQYNGEHWIKYYVYDKSTLRVVEIGRKFFVEVEK